MKKSNVKTTLGSKRESKEKNTKNRNARTRNKPTKRKERSQTEGGIGRDETCYREET
jgi:hypothetical protein